MYFNRWKKFLQQRFKLRQSTEKSKIYQQLLTKIVDIENELFVLKQFKEREITDVPIIIENIHIENFKVDKIDHEINFGALGIKDLAGQLYIGANYHTGVLKRGINIDQKNQEHCSKTNDNVGPRYTIGEKK